MTQSTTCHAPECDETLKADKYGRGEGIMRGGAFFCDVDCYHDHQRSEIMRVTKELTSK